MLHTNFKVIGLSVLVKKYFEVFTPYVDINGDLV